MLETLVILLAAHLLGDFPLQSNWIVRHKREFHVLLLHATIVTGLTWILLRIPYCPILLITFASHVAIDLIKARKGNQLNWFFADQTAHLAVILALAWYYRTAAATGWSACMSPEVSPWYYAALSTLSGLILLTYVGGHLVGLGTERYLVEIRRHLVEINEPQFQEGLKGAGRLIGYLERSLAFLLILINQPAGIGFLIAAKSILRFGEIKERKDRMFAEYVLIGTLMSFGWALLTSILTVRAIHHWLPSAPTIP